MTSDVVLARLTQLHPKLIDLSLTRVKALLSSLGNPHHNLPPVIHVAGTNGKGSVIAFLRSILEAAGLRVHVYTSPHLVQFHERILLAGQAIKEEMLCALLEECEATLDDHITFFEITTTAAFLAFARTPADIVLLETGLGGRLDATNVVPNPVLTAITPVSFDHQHFLGQDLAKIAKEKAGIMKPGIACISAKQSRTVTKVLQNRAQQLGCPFLQENQDYYIRSNTHYLSFRICDIWKSLPLPNLVGQHQIHNAAQALACINLLNRSSVLEVPQTALALGLQSVVWPARLQHLTKGPLVEILPENWELWLDGGHNPAAASVIAQQSHCWKDRPLYFIIGMMQDKDLLGFLTNLKDSISTLCSVSIPGKETSMTANEIAKVAKIIGLNASTASSVIHALYNFKNENSCPARVLICGSLYLAGTVLAENG